MLINPKTKPNGSVRFLCGFFTSKKSKEKYNKNSKTIRFGFRFKKKLKNRTGIQTNRMSNNNP